MYKPLIENNSNFKDMMEIRDGKFFIDNECKATQRALLMHINDNVYKNLEKFSIRLFDQDARWNKAHYNTEDKSLIVEKLVDLGNRKKQENLLFEATDRILYAHRNLKLLIFLTSGPFFIGFFAFKYAVKIALILFFYKKTKGKRGAIKWH